MFPVGAIAAAAAAAAAHARRVQEQRKALAAAGPVWDQVAARLGFRASRDAGGYPRLDGALDDVPCVLAMVDVGRGAAARVDAVARARVPSSFAVSVGPRRGALARWLFPRNEVLVGDLPFDRTFSTLSRPAAAAPRLLADRRTRDLLMAFRAHGVKHFAYDGGRIAFAWPGVEVAPAWLEAAVELLVVIGRQDPAAVMPYR